MSSPVIFLQTAVAKMKLIGLNVLKVRSMMEYTHSNYQYTSMNVCAPCVDACANCVPIEVELQKKLHRAPRSF